jgi:hypothetical protein
VLNQDEVQTRVREYNTVQFWDGQNRHYPPILLKYEQEGYFRKVPVPNNSSDGCIPTSTYLPI